MSITPPPILPRWNMINMAGLEVALDSSEWTGLLDLTIKDDEYMLVRK